MNNLNQFSSPFQNMALITCPTESCGPLICKDMLQGSLIENLKVGHRSSTFLRCGLDCSFWFSVYIIQFLVFRALPLLFWFLVYPLLRFLHQILSCIVFPPHFLLFTRYCLVRLYLLVSVLTLVFVLFTSAAFIFSLFI